VGSGNHNRSFDRRRCALAIEETVGQQRQGLLVPPPNIFGIFFLFFLLQVDHSWRDILEQQERERRLQAAYAAQMKEPVPPTVV